MSNGVQQVFFTKLTDVHTSSEGAKETLGAIRFHGGNIYKYVTYHQGAGAIAAVAGQVVYIYAPGGVSAGLITTVTSDLSDSAEIGAGVLQAVIPHLGFGWVQVKGNATLSIALTAGADGDPLTPTGATDGTLDVSAAVTDVICATAVDASARIILCDFPF